MTIRTLVLSGGGGRGAFHAGVYKYLCEHDKPGIDADHNDAWVPDIVVGTSIGAVNGAAIVQGIKWQALERFWLSLRENDIQGLPPGMGWLARRVTNMILRQAIGVRLPHMSEEEAFSPKASESWPPLPILPRWLGTRLIGRWSNLLDTGPLFRTLTERLGLDEEGIANAEGTLLISATNVRTGEGTIFCNRDIIDPDTGNPRPNLRSPITLKRIIASCSIPMVYPWTKDEDGEVYWDGAVVTNTPLGPAFDAVANRPIDEPMEAVIVMMTPWWEKDSDAPRHDQLPQDFGEAMTWTLDWALLASFRSDLKLTRSCNAIARMAIDAGKAPPYRHVEDIIVAPMEFMPVARIIDYDEPASRELIRLGYEAAERAFKAKFAQQP
jgi:NTE family protein